HQPGDGHDPALCHPAEHGHHKQTRDEGDRCDPALEVAAVPIIVVGLGVAPGEHVVVDEVPDMITVGHWRSPPARLLPVCRHDPNLGRGLVAQRHIPPADADPYGLTYLAGLSDADLAPGRQLPL